MSATDPIEAALDTTIEWKGEKLAVRAIMRDGAFFCTQTDVDLLISCAQGAAIAAYLRARADVARDQERSEPRSYMLRALAYEVEREHRP